MRSHRARVRSAPVTYTTQTFEQPRGAFHWRRVLTGAFIVTLVSIGAVMFTPISNSARALTFHSSIVGRPSLTTIAPDKEAIATTSVALLAERLATPDPDEPGREVQVDFQLVVREST